MFVSRLCARLKGIMHRIIEYEPTDDISKSVISFLTPNSTVL